MILALVVLLAMFAQDTAEAAKVSLLNRRHPWLAGWCELVNDWGAALSVGISGSALLRYGLAPATVAIFIALGAASVLGTRAGDWLANRKGGARSEHRS